MRIITMRISCHSSPSSPLALLTSRPRQEWFDWDETQANLLFTAAGVANLLCAVVMSVLSGPRAAADGRVTQLVSDRALLVASCVLGLVGWLLMVPPSGWSVLFDEAADNADMGLAQFGAAFFLVTVAFPFGRGVCLSMVGKLLGDRPQGAWMGIMFALGAIARIAGPFWAVTGYAWFGSFAVFGSSGALFAAALLATRVLWAVLVPDDDDEVAPAPADFVGTKREYGLASPAHHISPRLRSQEAEPRLYAGSPNITPRSFSLTPALNSDV